MATATRPALGPHLHQGLRVFNVHNHRVYRIAHVWEDRSVTLTAPGGTRHCITQGDLLRSFRMIQPYGGAR